MLPSLAAILFLILSVVAVSARRPSAAWGTIPSPNPGFGPNDLKSISAVNAKDIWAVGIAAGDSLTMHWDGTSWTIVPTPDFPLDAPLQGVTAIASNDVWAVGFQNDASSLNSSTVILHWNGRAWRKVPSPNPGGNSVDKLLRRQGGRTERRLGGR